MCQIRLDAVVHYERYGRQKRHDKRHPCVEAHSQPVDKESGEHDQGVQIEHKKMCEYHLATIAYERKYERQHMEENDRHEYIYL